MSSHGIKYRKKLPGVLSHVEEGPLEAELSRIIIPHSEFLHKSSNSNDDSRSLALSKRDPLFKALLRIEFESACLDYIFARTFFGKKK